MRTILTILIVCLLPLLVAGTLSAQWVQTNGPCKSIPILSLMPFPNGTGGTNILAGTYDGVFLSTNNGTRWAPIKGNLPGNCNGAILSLTFRSNGKGGTNIYAGTYCGVFLSTDYGAQWMAVNNGLTYNLWASVQAFEISDSIIYAGIGDYDSSDWYSGGVFRSTNDGANWTATGLTGTYVKSLVICGTHLFAGTVLKGIYRSTNNGDDWDTVNTGLKNLWINCLTTIDTILFAGSDGKGIYRSTDYGAHWINVGFPGQRVNDLKSNGKDLFAAVSPMGVYLSTDQGSNWIPLHNGLTTSPIQSIAIYTDSVGTTYIFAGSDNGIFVSANYGQLWKTANIGFRYPWISDLIVASDDSGGSMIYAATGRDGIFRSTDNGINWDAVNSGLSSSPDIRALGVNGHNLFAGASAAVIHSTNNGGNWTMVDSNRIVLAFLSNGSYLYAGTEHGVILSTDDGTNWNAVNNGIPEGRGGECGWGIPSVNTLAASGENLYASGGGGMCSLSGIYRSKSNDTTWIRIDTSIAPEAFLGNIAAGGSATNLFAGTDNGVYVSTNEGVTWTAANNGLPKSSYDTSRYTGVRALASSGSNVFVATEHNGVFLSSDDGATWNSISAGLRDSNIVRLVVSQTDILAATTTGIWRRPLSEMINAVPPAPVSLESPLNEASNVPPILSIQWSRSQFASSYRLQLSSDSLFRTTFLDRDYLTNNVFPIGPLPSQTKLYWRVRANNFTGGEWSPVWHFETAFYSTKVTLASPPDRRQELPAELSFGWSRPQWAAWYHLQVAGDIKFREILVDVDNLSDTSWSGTPFAPSKMYYWHVRSGNKLGYSNWSSMWSFETGSYALELASPPDGSIEHGCNIELSCFAPYEPLLYHVQIASDAQFQSLIFNDSAVTGNKAMISSFTDNTWCYWRVRGKYIGGIWDGWTPAWRVRQLWSAQTSGTTSYLLGVSFADANTGTAVGVSGAILHTTNEGTSWTSQVSGTSNNLYGICFPDVNTGTAVGAGGTIVRTTDGGVSWISQLSGTMNDLRAATFSDANTGTAVGADGTILRTTDGGSTWTSQTSGTSLRLYGVSFSDANIGTAVGQSGTILHTTNGGFTWTSQTSGTINNLNGISFSGANVGTTVGQNGIILRTTDGGVIWASQTSGTEKELLSVSMSDTADAIAVGSGGLILRTTNSGAAWDKEGCLTTNTLNGVFFGDQNRAIVVGTKGTILCMSINGVEGIEDRNMPKLPHFFTLAQNYPNPFNPVTTINYQLPSQSHVTLKVFNVLGREVATLADGMEEAGYKSVEWCPSTSSGRHVASGVYFYRLEAASADDPLKTFTNVKKMALVK
jgi:photosystem II stability/assembly factor-like uncharacterized protein